MINANEARALAQHGFKSDIEKIELGIKNVASNGGWRYTFDHTSLLSKLNVSTVDKYFSDLGYTVKIQFNLIVLTW